MNVALTWQQIVAILVGIPTAIVGMLLFAPDLAPNRPTLAINFGIGLLICVGFTLWHRRRVHRSDLHPDVLTTLVPAHLILELGRCHLYSAARMWGNMVEIAGYAQNLNDGPGRLELTFVDRSSLWNDRVVIPPLVCDIPPAAVVQFGGRFLCSGPVGRTYKVFLEGRYQAGGRQVRFARRRVLSKRVNPATTAFALTMGALYVGGGTSLSFVVQADRPTAPPPLGDAPWTSTPVWLPPAPEASSAVRVSG
jgi:hypothetical protein